MSYELKLDVQELLVLVENQVDAVHNRWAAYQSMMMNESLLDETENEEYVAFVKDELANSMDKLNTYINILNKHVDSKLGEDNE